MSGRFVFYFSVHKYVLCSCCVLSWRYSSEQEGRKFLPMGKETINIKRFKITSGEIFVIQKNGSGSEKHVVLGGLS